MSERDQEMPVWKIRTGSWKTKFVLVMLATKAELGDEVEIEPTISGIAYATELSPLEVKLSLNTLLDQGHIVGADARHAGYDDVLDIEVGPGVINGTDRRIFRLPKRGSDG